MNKIILLTGGGTGGHIYPLLAVYEEIVRTNPDSIKIYYIGPKNIPIFDEFRKNGIYPYSVISSKLRRYFSLQNLLDIPKFFLSIIQMLWRMYFIMPDVVFSKGGPGTLAVVIAAKFYMIPIIIHESDSVPSLTSKISSKFAKRIGISFQNTSEYFKNKKIAFVGNPVRNLLLQAVPQKITAIEKLGFNSQDPIIFVLGGSQGSTRINDFIFTNLKELLKKYQIFHQVGAKNKLEAESIVKITLKDESEDLKKRYKYSGFLNIEDMREIFSASDIVISRAGSGAIYEISAFGKPSILIPLTESAGDHQRINAYEYEKYGGTIVIEEENFSPNITFEKLEAILGNEERMKSMSEGARRFFKPDASSLLANEILTLAKVNSEKQQIF